jgi:hypothetical protein
VPECHPFGTVECFVDFPARPFLRPFVLGCLERIDRLEHGPLQRDRGRRDHHALAVAERGVPLDVVRRDEIEELRVRHAAVRGRRAQRIAPQEPRDIDPLPFDVDAIDLSAIAGLRLEADGRRLRERALDALERHGQLGGRRRRL